MKAWMATAVVVAVCAAPCLAEGFDVVGQAMGNTDLIQVRVGLGDPNGITSWGLSVVHEPKTDVREQHTSFGLFGMLSRPIQIIEPGTVPGLWAGLSVEPFLDLDVLYDFDYSDINIWPGAGVLLAPTETVSFIGRAFYAFGDSDIPSQIQPDTWNYTIGLQIRF